MSAKHVLTQTQLESLTSPIRLAIVRRLAIDKRASARDLAHNMGRPVRSLYHHLKQLQAVGLLRVVGERRGARRPEAVYAAVADYLSSVEVVKTRKGSETYARAAARAGEAGIRAFSAAVQERSARFEGADRNAMVRFFVLRADGKKLAQVNKLLNQLERALGQGSEEGEEIMLTLMLSPQRSKG